MPVSLNLGDPVCIAPVADWCGEGAVWHPQQQALYWTDINRFLIHRWKSISGALVTWKFSEPVTALALTTDDSVLLVVLASRIMLWRAPVAGEAYGTNGETMYRLPEWPQARCNDARVDPAGVLWIATMQNNVAADGTSLSVNQAIGRLFSLDAAMQVKTGQIKTWRSQLFIGNTLAWSPDRRFFYSADTLADEIRRYDYSADGTIANEIVWHKGDESHGLPDGSCMDAEGYLWNCRHGGGSILRIDPNGRIERVIAMPVRNPTTCVFGGADGTTLYVTSASLGDEDHPLSGGLFSIETNVHGLPPNRFRLKLT